MNVDAWIMLVLVIVGAQVKASKITGKDKNRFQIEAGRAEDGIDVLSKLSDDVAVKPVSAVG
mgnify:CR=1